MNSVDPEKLRSTVTRLDLWEFLSAQNEINALMAQYISAGLAGRPTTEAVDDLLKHISDQHDRTVALITRSMEGGDGKP